MDDHRGVQVHWLGEYCTRIDVRGVHQILGDETPAYGGTDSGPMPTELLLAALGSCMCLAVAHVARKRRLAFDALTVEVDADKDRVEFRFREIAVLVCANLPQDQLAPLVAARRASPCRGRRPRGGQARRYCFVSDTLAAGCTIRYTAESTAAASAPASPA